MTLEVAGVTPVYSIKHEYIFKSLPFVGIGQDAPLANQLDSSPGEEPQASDTYSSLAESQSSFGAPDRGGSFGRHVDHRMHATTTRETTVQSSSRAYCPDCLLTGAVRNKITRRHLPSYCSYCSYSSVIGGYVRAKPICSRSDSRYPLTPPERTSKNSKFGQHLSAVCRFLSYRFSKRPVRTGVANSKEVAS